MSSTSEIDEFMAWADEVMRPDQKIVNAVVGIVVNAAVTSSAGEETITRAQIATVAGENSQNDIKVCMGALAACFHERGWDVRADLEKDALVFAVPFTFAKDAPERIELFQHLNVPCPGELRHLAVVPKEYADTVDEACDIAIEKLKKMWTPRDYGTSSVVYRFNTSTFSTAARIPALVVVQRLFARGWNVKFERDSSRVAFTFPVCRLFPANEKE